MHFSRHWFSASDIVLKQRIIFDTIDTLRNANSPPKKYEPTPIQISNEELERHGAHRMVDDMEIEDETPSVSRTVQTTKFNFLDEPYHVPVPILNMSPQQKKMKITLTLISASCSTFLLQMNEVLPQIME